MKVLPYIIAMFAGLFARTIAASLGGIDYTMAAHPDMRVIAEQIQRQLFPDEIGGSNAD